VLNISSKYRIGSCLQPNTFLYPNKLNEYAFYKYNPPYPNHSQLEHVISVYFCEWLYAYRERVAIVPMWKHIDESHIDLEFKSRYTFLSEDSITWSRTNPNGPK